MHGALLHISFLLRVTHDLVLVEPLRSLGGINAGAILPFLGATAFSVLYGPDESDDEKARRPSLDLDPHFDGTIT